MTRMLSLRLALIVAASSLVTASPRAAGAQEPRQQGMPAASAKAIAAQLGAKLQPRDGDELDVGHSFTATLETPEKLEDFGIKGMHAGARVTVARVGPDRIRIEADEMDPVPARGSTTVKLDGKGGLVPVGKG